MSSTHDSWARYYDFVYDECFGESFWRLTAETLRVIGELLPPAARVLDLGAGTGRLAIPLALLGHDVTAVEGSAGMADVLEQRAAEVGVRIDLRREDFRILGVEAQVNGGRVGSPDEPYDIALAIFTVLNYVVLEDDLTRVARAVASRLRPGGCFVFDVAARRLFASAVFESGRLRREIQVRQLAPGLFKYRDSGCGRLNRKTFRYDEVFTLRYWRDDELLPRFAENGLILTAEVTDRLRESGSRWFVLRRT